MATFSFPSLPWFCQKRFAELCDTETMIKFKQLSPQTAKLSKNRRIYEWIKIGDRKHPDPDQRKNAIGKYLPVRILQNVDINDIKNVEIFDEMRFDLDRITKEFLQSFSFNAPDLNITSFNIEFDALKMLLERKVTGLYFFGTIVFKNVDKEMEYLFNRFMDMKVVTFTILFYRDPSEHIIEAIEKLKTNNRKYYYFWNLNSFCFGISKARTKPALKN